MIATVMPVRSLLLFTVRKANERESFNCIFHSKFTNEFERKIK
jgi:hypothetical protein